MSFDFNKFSIYVASLSIKQKSLSKFCPSLGIISQYPEFYIKQIKTNDLANLRIICIFLYESISWHFVAFNLIFPFHLSFLFKFTTPKIACNITMADNSFIKKL